MKALKIFAIGLVFLTGLLGSGCNSGSNKKDTPKEIKLGVIYPLTGDAAFWGNNAKKGVELAVEDFIKSNKGIDIKVIYEDSKSSTKDAVNAVNKLIFQDKVKFIAGDLVSSNLLAIAPICEQNKVVAVGQGSNPKIKDAGQYIFRTWPSDDLQGRALAYFLENNLKPQNPSLIFINNEYGNGVADVISRTYSKEILFKEKYDPAQRDFRNLILKIPAKSDAIVIIGYPEELPVLLKQLSEANKMLTVIGTETFENKDIKTAKHNFQMFYTVPAFADSASNSYKIFVQSYKNKFGSEPGVPSDPVYDATMLLLLSIKEVGYDPDKVKNHLLNIHNYQGASGRISFNVDGDVIKDFIIKSLKNNKDSVYTKIILDAQ